MTLSTIKTLLPLIVTATILSFSGTMASAQTSPSTEPVNQKEDGRRSLYNLCHESFDSTLCLQAGKLYEDASAGPVDIRIAIEMYNYACRANKALGCALQGAAIYNNAETAAERFKALEPWIKGCEGNNGRGGNNGRACNGLGTIYKDKEFENTDLTKAFGFFEKACKLGWQESCISVGVALEDGSGVEKNPTKATEMYIRLCEADYGKGCNYAGFSYSNGIGLGENLSLASKSFEKGCEIGNLDTCHNFAYALAYGRGIKEDTARAFTIWSNACELKHSWSCYQVAVAYALGRGIPQDTQKALAFGDLSCQPGNPYWKDACHTFAHKFWDELTFGFNKDLGKARAIMEKVCAAGDKDSCDHVAELKANKEKSVIHN